LNLSILGDIDDYIIVSFLDLLNLIFIGVFGRSLLIKKSLGNLLLIDCPPPDDDILLYRYYWFNLLGSNVSCFLSLYDCFSIL